MDRTFGRDFTTGSIPKQLLIFSLPILLGNLITTGYSIINAVWVGNLLGGSAVGAVAVAFPIVMLLVALISGGTTAASILIARFYGSKEPDRIQKVVNNSWTVGFAVVLIVTMAGVFAAGRILQIIGTPPELLEMATDYLRITLYGFVFMYFSNLVVSILRGIGDTTTPMIFMILSTLINALLDPVLILGMGPFPKLGLNGSAVASLVSLGLGTLAGLLYCKRKYEGLPINFRKFEFDLEMISTIAKLGLPIFIQQTLISVSSAFMVFFVNGFGTHSIAAYGVTSRIDSIAILPAMAVFMAVATLTAQNMGAGKPERIGSIFRWGLILNSAVIFVISVGVVGFSKTIMHMFVSDQTIIDIGANYMKIVGSSYILFAISFVSNGVINGAGKPIVPMLFSFLSLCVVRIPLAWLLSKTALGITGIWFVIVLSFATTTILSLAYYYSGRWNNLREVRVGSSGAIPVNKRIKEITSIR